MLILNIRWLIFSCYWGKKRKCSNLSEKKLVLILFIEDLPGLICVNKHAQAIQRTGYHERKKYI